MLRARDIQMCIVPPLSFPVYWMSFGWSENLNANYSQVIKAHDNIICNAFCYNTKIKNENLI